MKDENKNCKNCYHYDACDFIKGTNVFGENIASLNYAKQGGKFTYTGSKPLCKLFVPKEEVIRLPKCFSFDGKYYVIYRESNHLKLEDFDKEENANLYKKYLEDEN